MPAGPRARTSAPSPPPLCLRPRAALTPRGLPGCSGATRRGSAGSGRMSPRRWPRGRACQPLATGRRLSVCCSVLGPPGRSPGGGRAVATTGLALLWGRGRQESPCGLGLRGLCFGGTLTRIAPFLSGSQNAELWGRCPGSLSGLLGHWALSGNSLGTKKTCLRRPRHSGRGGASAGPRPAWLVQTVALLRWAQEP